MIARVYAIGTRAQALTHGRAVRGGETEERGAWVARWMSERTGGVRKEGGGGRDDDEKEGKEEEGGGGGRMKREEREKARKGRRKERGRREEKDGKRSLGKHVFFLSLVSLVYISSQETDRPGPFRRKPAARSKAL